MKTATITYHNVNNYGAVLQAYALQQAQRNLGIDNVIINYCSEKNKLYQNIKGKSPKIFLVNTMRYTEFLINLRVIRKRSRHFKEFTYKKLNLTRKYNTFEELKSNPPNADWYIAGSDQLWNISTMIRKEFFLDFGDSNIKRASYAVSMGSSYNNVQYQNQLQELISQFNSISVREAEAREYIEQLVENKLIVQKNCDPVFLLSNQEWTDFSKIRMIRTKYILCYPMSGHPIIKKALERLKQLTGYQIVVITTELFTHIKGDINIKDASVEEFIYLVQNAEYVLTTSFHGTAFSCLFNIKFFALLGNSAPTRISELLKHLGLENRIIRNDEEITTDEIDFSYTNKVIESEREAGLRYLSSLS